ncbi:MAG: hypothetical protein ACRBBW_20505 [Cellvibrionaceae bacterium]
MIHGIKYNTASGEIVMAITVPTMADLLLQWVVGYEVLDLPEPLENTADWYVVEGEIMPRPDMGIVGVQTSLEVNELMECTNIPEGVQLRYPGGEAVVAGGGFSWGAAEKGSYRFELTKFPYKEEVFDVVIRDI